MAQQLPFYETTYSTHTQRYDGRRRNIAIKTIPENTYMFTYMRVPFDEADGWTQHQRQCHYIQFLMSQYLNKTVRYNRNTNLFYICFSQEKPNGTFFYPCPGASFGVLGAGNTFNLAITTRTTRPVRLAYLKSGTHLDRNPNMVASRRVNLEADDDRIRQCNFVYYPCTDSTLPPPQEPASRVGTGIGPEFDPCVVGAYSRKAHIDGWTSVARGDMTGYFRLNDEDLRQDAGDDSMYRSLREQNLLAGQEFANQNPDVKRRGFLSMLGQDLIPLTLEATAHPRLTIGHNPIIVTGVPEYVIHGSGWQSFYSRATNAAGEVFADGGRYPTGVAVGGGLTDMYGASVYSVRMNVMNPHDRLSTTYAIRPEFLERFVNEYLLPTLTVNALLFTTHIGNVENMLAQMPLNIQPGALHPEPNANIRYQINMGIYNYLANNLFYYDSLKNVFLRQLPNRTIYTLKIDEKRQRHAAQELTEWIQQYNDYCHPINFGLIYQAETVPNAFRDRAILYKYNIVKLLKCALNCYKHRERFAIFGYGGHYNNIFDGHDVIRVPNGPFIEPWSIVRFPSHVNPNGLFNGHIGMRRFSNLLRGIMPGFSRIKDILHDLGGGGDPGPAGACLRLGLAGLPVPPRVAQATITEWASFNDYRDHRNYLLQTEHNNRNYMYALAIIANMIQPRILQAAQHNESVRYDWSMDPPGEPPHGTEEPEDGHIWYGGRRKTNRNYRKKKNTSRKKTQ